MNLLSQAGKERWRQTQRQREFLTLAVSLITLEVCIAAGIFFLRSTLQQETTRLTNELAATASINSTNRQLPITQETKLINSWLAVVKKNTSLDYPWPDVLYDINQAGLPGIHFQALSLSLATRQFSLSGHANTRTSLLEFEQNLTKLSTLSDVNAPIANLLKRENLDFTITATLTPPSQ
jgi:Tfp pilus assembly protein PilN